MHSEIRKTILETARKLFNEQGYSKTSMRAIADECGIAVGNLTYHFHKKNDLVIAIMQDAFVVAKPEGPILTLFDLTDQFSRMLDTLLRHAFYFIDDEFVGEQHEHNDEIRKRILSGFDYLIQRGYFSEDFDMDTRQAILNMLLMTHPTWLRVSIRAQAASSKAEFLRLHWIILFPYLTEKGKQEYDLIKNQPPLV